MPYLVVQDFKLGLDARKNIITSPPGALIKCANAHITRGGEIEKRKAFELVADLSFDEYNNYDVVNPEQYPWETFGIEVTGEGVWVFAQLNKQPPDGPGTDADWLMVSELYNNSSGRVRVMFLEHPHSSETYGSGSFSNNQWKLNKIRSSTVYNGRVFVLAEWVVPNYLTEGSGQMVEVYAYYDDGTDYYFTKIINGFPNTSPYPHRRPKLVKDFYKGMTHAVSAFNGGMSVRDFCEELVDNVIQDPNFSNSVIGPDDRSIIIEGPPGKDYVLEAGVLAPTQRYTEGNDYPVGLWVTNKIKAPNLTVVSELIQSKTDAVVAEKATSTFAIIGGTESRAFNLAYTKNLAYQQVKVTQIWVDGDGDSTELLGLSSGSFIQWNSFPNHADYEASAKLLASIAYHINANTSTHGFTAVATGRSISGGTEGKLTLYSPSQDASFYNGYEIWAEFDNTFSEVYGWDESYGGGGFVVPTSVRQSTRPKVGAVATNSSGFYHESKFLRGVLQGATDNFVSSVKVDGIEILGESIPWSESNNNTMSDVVIQINNFQNDYDAVVEDNKIKITHNAGGADENGKSVLVTKTGDVALSGITQMSGGKDAVTGTPQKNKITIGLDGWDGTSPEAKWLTAGAKVQINTKIGDQLDYVNHCASDVTGIDAVYALPFRSKMHVCGEKSVYFSELENPTNWNPDSTGAGFINFSNNYSSVYGTKAIAPYTNYLGIFSERNIQVWNWDPDPEKNSQQQVLANTGLISPAGVCPIGDVDVFYLSGSGIRSLRARDSSNSAMSSDVGTQIDPIVSAAIDSLQGNMDFISSAIEPSDGRYMISIKDKIYVLSYFINSNIQAWSTYEPNLGNIDRIVSSDKDLYLRADGKIYKLSKTLYSTYQDPNVCEIIMPYLDAQKPAHTKTFYGIDATIEGVWQVSGGTNTTNTSAVELIATINNPTFQLGRIMFTGIGTHVGIRMISPANTNSKCTIGNVMIHYKLNDAD